MKFDKTINPFVSLNRAIRILERIAVTTSFVLVIGTAGYLSVMALTS